MSAKPDSEEAKTASRTQLYEMALAQQRHAHYRENQLMAIQLITEGKYDEAQRYLDLIKEYKG